MARRKRHEEFHSWSGRAADIAGQRLPRTYDISTQPPEVLEEGNARAIRFGQELPAIAAADLKQVEGRLANPKEARNPAYQKGLEVKLAHSQKAAKTAEEVGAIDTSVEGMTANVQRLLNHAINKARSATRYNEQSGSPKMELPAGFDFYPEHAGAYGDISRRNFGNDPEKHSRLVKAATPFSAGAMPRVELQGAAGLARLTAGGGEYGITLDDASAKYLNEAASKVKSGGHEITPVSAGNYSLTDKRLSPEHASVILQHHKNAMEGKPTHEALSKVQFSHGAQDLAPAASAVIGAAGTSGAGVVANGLRIMDSPHHFSNPPATPGAWKVPSYGTTTLLHNEDHANLSKTLEHMVGAAVHGEEYWNANPGAQEHVQKYMNHPALTSPHIVSDIHNARALLAGGLDYKTGVNMGDRLRPESMFTRPSHFGKDEIQSTRRGSGIQTPDLGYLIQEHATREAKMSFPMGGQRHELPGHAKQALIWYAQQANEPTNKAQIKEGSKSVIHSVVKEQPTKSLNPIVTPDL